MTTRVRQTLSGSCVNRDPVCTALWPDRLPMPPWIRGRGRARLTVPVLSHATPAHCPTPYHDTAMSASHIDVAPHYSTFCLLLRYPHSVTEIEH